MIDLIDKIHWLGHASFRIHHDSIIYIDPWNVASRAEEADLILITHCHFDHLSHVDIDKIATCRTTIATPISCGKKLDHKTITLRPGDRRILGGVDVEALPAYNVSTGFHPRKNDWLGFLLHLPDGRVYIAGDTDLIPEMDDIRADIALLPIGGSFTMTAEEAVEAAVKVHARIAVPMHWGHVVGVDDDAQRFRDLASARGIEVRILDAER